MTAAKAATGAANPLVNGLTILGGSGNDDLIAVTNATLTGNGGSDTFDAMNFINSASSMASITDFTVGKDGLVLQGATDTFTSQAVNVSAATDLSSALNLATGAQGVADGFNYGGNTYVVEDDSGNANVFTSGTDHVVQLAGSVDLSHLAVTSTVGGHSLLA